MTSFEPSVMECALLIIQKERKVEWNTFICDQQLAIFGRVSDEQELCDSLSLWERLCVVNSRQGYNDGRVGKRDVTCPCHRGESHCIIATGESSYNVSTAIDVLEFSAEPFTLTANASSFSLKFVAVDTTGSDALCTINGSENVVLMRSLLGMFAVTSSDKNVVLGNDHRIEVEGCMVKVFDALMWTGCSFLSDVNCADRPTAPRTCV